MRASCRTLDAAYNLARHLLRNEHEAEDAVVESFVRAIRYLGGLRAGDGRAWLLTALGPMAQTDRAAVCQDEPH